MLQVEEERESVRVLLECIDLQRSKSRDYQNPNSSVRQADHYLNGIQTIYDMLHQKMLRARSLLEATRAGSGGSNHESMEDTFKDIINYASFAVSWLRFSMDGQSKERDIFNRKVPQNTYTFQGTSLGVDPSTVSRVLVGDTKLTGSDPGVTSFTKQYRITVGPDGEAKLVDLEDGAFVTPTKDT